MKLNILKMKHSALVTEATRLLYYIFAIVLGILFIAFVPYLPYLLSNQSSLVRYSLVSAFALSVGFLLRICLKKTDLRHSTAVNSELFIATFFSIVIALYWTFFIYLSTLFRGSKEIANEAPFAVLGAPVLFPVDVVSFAVYVVLMCISIFLPFGLLLLQKQGHKGRMSLIIPVFLFLIVFLIGILQLNMAMAGLM